MRAAASLVREYKVLGGLVEQMRDLVADDPALSAALREVLPGSQDALDHALGHPTNPWVSVAAPEDLPGDARGGYSTDRPSTVLLARPLAEALEEGGLAATREAVRALLVGVVHFVAGRDWGGPQTELARAFDAALGSTEPAAPARHEAPAEGPATVPVVPAAPDDAAGDAPAETPVAYMLGAAILDVARRHLGQRYAFTPTPDYDDPDWKGPFDCAEYASYCAFRAYGIPYGVVANAAKRFDSYSGYWQRDANDRGIRISWRDALHIPGALLLRFPPRQSPPPYGHVAISLGDGNATYEALGRNYGVVRHKALNRSWNCGVLLPGVLYDTPDGIGSDLLVFKAFDPPAGHSPIVERVQERLVELGYLAPPQVTGVYEGATEAAVTQFQIDGGLTVDGEVGPVTGEALGLGAIWDEAPVGDRPALASAPPDGEGGALDAEVLTLARTLWGEARGEPREGQEAVAGVIMNRVRSARYPNTVAKVCLQRWQFSCWNENDPNRRKIERLMPGDDPLFDSLIEVARDAVFGRLRNRVADALHYHATHVSPSWVVRSPAAELVLRIGAHLFWRGIR
jgi:hypothetical protein